MKLKMQHDLGDSVEIRIVENSEKTRFGRFLQSLNRSTREL